MTVFETRLETATSRRKNFAMFISAVNCVNGSVIGGGSVCGPDSLGGVAGASDFAVVAALVCFFANRS